MGKQIIASNAQTTAVYRFIDKKIYLKVNDMTYASQIIAQLEAKGAKLRHSRGWIEADILGDKQNFIISGVEFDASKLSDKDLEEHFFNLFLGTLKNAKFDCKESNF